MGIRELLITEAGGIFDMRVWTLQRPVVRLLTIEPVLGGILHENLQRRESVKGSSDRSFGFVFAAVFALVALLPLLRTPHAPRWWALPIALAFAAFAVCAPRWLGPLNRAWLKIGLLLSAVISPIVLGLLFYSTLFPVGFFMRLAGKHPLRLRRDQENSYWISRDHGAPASSMKQQF